MAQAMAVGEANARATAQAKAEEQANIALARQFAAQAQTLFAAGNSTQQTAVLLAIQSMRLFTNGDAVHILQNNTLFRIDFRLFFHLLPANCLLPHPLQVLNLYQPAH